MKSAAVALRLRLCFALLLSLVLCAQSVDLRTTFKIDGSKFPSFLATDGVEEGGDSGKGLPAPVDEDGKTLEDRDDVRPQLIVLTKANQNYCKEKGFMKDEGILFGRDPEDADQCICGAPLDPDDPLAKHVMVIPTTKGTPGNIESFGDKAEAVECVECRVDVTCNKDGYKLQKEGGDKHVEGDKYWCVSVANCDGNKEPATDGCTCKYEVKPKADFEPRDALRADKPKLEWDPTTNKLFYSWKRANVKLECLPGWIERKGQGVTYCTKPVPCPPEVKIPSVACGPSTVPYFKDYLRDAIETTEAINKCWKRGGPDVEAFKGMGKGTYKKYPPVEMHTTLWEDRNELGSSEKKDKSHYDMFKAFGQKFGIDHRDLETKADIEFVMRWVTNFGERFSLYKDKDSGVTRRNIPGTCKVATPSTQSAKTQYANVMARAKKTADMKTAILTQCVLKCKFLHYRAAETYFLGNRAALNGQKNCIPLDQPSGEITKDFMKNKVTTDPQKTCLKAYRKGLERKGSWPGMDPNNKKPLFADDCDEGTPSLYAVEAKAKTDMNGLCQRLYDTGGVISVAAAQEAAQSLGDEMGKKVVLMDSTLEDSKAKPIADCMGGGGQSKDQANTKEDECMKTGAVACQFHCAGRFQKGGVNTCIDSCFTDKGQGSDIGLVKARSTKPEIKQCISAIKRSATLQAGLKAGMAGAGGIAGVAKAKKAKSGSKSG